MLAWPVLLLLLGASFMLDSNLYLVDAGRALAVELELERPIVDLARADLLYVTTEDCLYKIDPVRQLVIDRTPLPLRFNHLVLAARDIILISSDEIVLLDRRNLSFKTGIGIERGDHRPLVRDRSVTETGGNYRLYLRTSRGSEDRMVILDLRSGKKIKERRTQPLRCVAYDPITDAIVAVDVKKNLSIYDRSLNRKRRIALPIDPRAVSIHAAGMLFDADEGIFLADRSGTILDFQPLTVHAFDQGPVALTGRAIIVLDTTVCRVAGWLENDRALVRFLPTAGTVHEFAVDRSNGLFMIQADPLAVIPLTVRRQRPEPIKAAAAPEDSLWYVQLGAFADRANAGHLRDVLRARGVPAFVDSSDLYRVKFGGITDKGAALHLAERLGLEGWLVLARKSPGVPPATFHVDQDKYVIEDGVVRKE